MPTRVLMPKGSDTMTEGKVLKWLKKEGDAVSDGDAIVEIETDKVDMEVESLGEGVLRKILVKEGDVVPVGHLIAIVAKPDEKIGDLVAETQKAAEEEPREEKKEEKPREAKPAEAPKEEAKEKTPEKERKAAEAPARKEEEKEKDERAAAGGRIFASPLARRIAQEKGIDLAGLRGSGPAGRIVRQDVERAVAAGPVSAPGARPPRPLAPFEGPEYRDEPLSSIRKVIAKRLVESKAPVPHFYLTVEVEMKRALELRESANQLDPELKLSVNDIILKATAAALRQHPEVNASFQGESVRVFNRVHLGVAVAIEGGGLITPVVRDADRKPLQEIAREVKELVARARNRKLKPEEYQGATFSVSNLGMMGIEEFSAVINPPEGAILAVGAVVEKPVVVSGRVRVGHRMKMTLSCDHRVMDGAQGARFLQTLKNILENPVYLAF
jgi:pyruvate dehydrogenase E2 component (dihydrolipoamide acetyltransferase)